MFEGYKYLFALFLLSLHSNTNEIKAKNEMKTKNCGATFAS